MTIVVTGLAIKPNHPQVLLMSMTTVVTGLATPLQAQDNENF